MLFAIGTTNIPKTNAIREALTNCPFMVWHDVQIKGCKVASGVPDMPLTLADLRNGAKNRAEEVRSLCPEANFFVGMEWGVYHDALGDESWLMWVVYIENTAGEWHFSYTCHMPVPPRVVAGLYDGSWRDLDQIVESLGAPPDTGDTYGSFGLWSDMMLSRSDQFRLAVQCAIAPFFNRFYTLEK
jgi:inosine/xanthosine triphosphatase